MHRRCVRRHRGQRPCWCDSPERRDLTKRDGNRAENRAREGQFDAVHSGPRHFRFAEVAAAIINGVPTRPFRRQQGRVPMIRHRRRVSRRSSTLRASAPPPYSRTTSAVGHTSTWETQMSRRWMGADRLQHRHELDRRAPARSTHSHSGHRPSPSGSKSGSTPAEPDTLCHLQTRETP